MSEPSIDDYIKYRIERARESIEEAKILLSAKHYATTVNFFITVKTVAQPVASKLA